MTAAAADQARQRHASGPREPTSASNAATPKPASVPTTSQVSFSTGAGAAWVIATQAKAAVPTTVSAAAPHIWPAIGRRWTRAASRIVHGTARTPMGCTTVTGASSRAVICRTAPTPVSASPPSHRGLRITASNCLPDSFVPGWPAVSPTARCWITDATARATDARTVRTTARGMFCVMSPQNGQISGTQNAPTTTSSSSSGSPSFQ